MPTMPDTGPSAPSAPVALDIRIFGASYFRVMPDRDAASAGAIADNVRPRAGDVLREHTDAGARLSIVSACTWLVIADPPAAPSAEPAAGG